MVATVWSWLTAYTWKQSPQSLFVVFCKQGRWIPTGKKLCHKIFGIQWEFLSCITNLPTGWSWSKSGSNFVTRWWHLSSSAIFFGNQWTWENRVNETDIIIHIIIKHSTQSSKSMILNAGCNSICKCQVLTFHLFSGPDIICNPSQRTDECIYIW